MKPALFRLLTLVLIATSLPISVRAADPYEMHAIFEQTGPLAFLGAKQTEVLHVLEGVVNAQGGIRGRPLKFVIHDDQTNPQVAIQLVSQLVAQKAPVVLGLSLTPLCTAVFPLVEKSGPVVWCGSPLARPQPGGFVFIYGPGINDVVPLVIRHFYAHGARNFALITTTDASGQVYDESFVAALNRPEFKGAKLVDREQYNATDLSIAAQVSRIKAAKPDIIISGVVGTPFGALLHALADADDVPVFGSGANLNVDQLSQYDAFVPKELYLNAAEGFLPDLKAPAAVRRQQTIFFDAMKKAGLGVVRALRYMGLRHAVRRCGPRTRHRSAKQIHQYIENQRSWVGIQGAYNFSTGDQKGIGESGATIVRWNRARRDFDLIATGLEYP